MPVSIPTVVPTADVFEYTAYESRYVRGSAKGKPITWRWEHVGPSPSTWHRYVKEHRALSEQVIPKDDAPGIVHGRTNGYRSNIDVFSCCALVIDCDAGALPDLTILKDVRYFVQYRPLADGSASKWHLVLPLDKAWTVPEVAVNQIGARRSAAIRYFAALLDRELDPTPAWAPSLLHPYTRRTADEPTPVTISNDAPGHLDLEAILADQPTYIDPLPRTPVEVEPGPITTFEAAVLQACSDAGLLKARRDEDKAWNVTCPFEETHTSKGGVTSTALFGARFKCLHGHCVHRPQAEFYRRVGVPAAALAAATVDVLESRVSTKVTVGEAQFQIRGVLAGAAPYAASAHIVRVTTGAGKTHAAADYLDSYTAPHFDEETGDIIPGRSAILAVPTNALLKEVDSRLNVDHVVRQGVLAVLNDDGSYACLKHTAAKALQNAGGDVHRLMCAKCEHRDGCPARAGAKRGEGSLTLTNHALLPSIAHEYHEAGRLPLIVWDECPSMVEVTTLKYTEIDWVVETFEAEERAQGRVTLESLDAPTIWGDRYRICARPLFEVLRRLRTTRDLGAAIALWGSTRAAEAQLQRAEAFLGLEATGTQSERVRRTAVAAKRTNVSELMFDQLSAGAQAAVLRAEAVGKAVDAVLEEGATLAPVLGGLQITALTPHGRLWKAHGGVVLDATAPVESLRALRADAVVTDLHVRDVGTTRRLVKNQAGLSRTALRERPTDKGALWSVAADLARELATFGEALGRPPKVAVFTYQSLVEELRGLLPTGTDVAYFGNTRGYDRWYQEGYDAFVTVGDPYSNLGAEAAVATYLGLDRDTLAQATAVSEAAQAHGRARSPQRKLVDGGRLHLHYGRLVPFGWDAENAIVDVGYGWDGE